VRSFSERTVGLVVPISYHSDRPGSVIEAVHLVRKTFLGSEILESSINGICEVHILVAWVNGDVVERIELATEKVVNENWGTSS